MCCNPFMEEDLIAQSASPSPTQVLATPIERFLADPFYMLIFDRSIEARLWAFFNVPPEDVLNGRSILQFYQGMGRNGALDHFRAVGAHEDIISAWEQTYPEGTVFFVYDDYELEDHDYDYDDDTSNGSPEEKGIELQFDMDLNEN